MKLIKASLNLCLVIFLSSFFATKCLAQNDSTDLAKNESTKAVCPSQNEMLPCTCDNLSIKCDRLNIELNTLTELFYQMSKKYAKTIFNSLDIISDKLTVIPANLTDKIRFHEIYLDGKNLRRVHWQAFSSSSKTLNKYVNNAPNMQTNESDPFKIFHFANYFLNLKHFSHRSLISVLPDRAFSYPLKKLETLSLNVGAIEGSPFYELDSLNQLSLTKGYRTESSGSSGSSGSLPNLDYIPSSAFKFGKKIKTGKNSWILRIDLSYNQLNGSSFEDGVFNQFSDWKDPVWVDLSYNNIETLKENVFGPLLNGNDRSYLILTGNSFLLSSSDCRSYWVYKNRAVYEGQLIGLPIYGQSYGASYSPWEESETWKYCEHKPPTNISI